ncbi:MAG: hypothetical protein KJN71_01250 [Acidimicrobiia bacterium]|nr:hypothetical protein [Acidimicrobiia bacterium]
MRRTPLVALVVALLASACTSGTDTSTTVSTSTTTTAPPTTTTTVPWERSLTDDELFVALIWNLHQPLVPVNDDGFFSEPWVRAHAVHDYLGLARRVEASPEIQVTFNLTPTLLIQLEALANGTRDVFWELTETSAGELADDERAFVEERFFETGPNSAARFPRLAELAALDELSDQDLTDLQILWNLSWVDPALADEPPLADIVARGRDFTEADKRTVLDEHERIIGEVLDAFRKLWDSGQVELTTSPLASPILPLVADTGLARVGDPDAVTIEFSEIYDAIEQVDRGVVEAERILGRSPVGMWPAGGAVTQLVMSLFSQQGISWVASGERALSPALGLGSGTFARDSSGAVIAAESLYRPWAADLFRNPDVAMFFGDARLEDLVERGYGRVPAGVAAGDLVRRLESIADEAGPGSVVTLVVDELLRYDGDGTDRIETMYRALSRSDRITTVTPSRYLETFGNEIEGLDEVVAASAEASSFTPWIGEAVEASAWSYLARTRQAVAAAGDPADALGLILYAEAGDWLRHYATTPSAQTDAAFRDLLADVYESLDREGPGFLSVPLVPATPATPSRVPGAAVAVTIDNDIDDQEWDGATVYDVSGSLIDRLHVATTDADLLVRVDFTREVLGDDSVGFALYLGAPGATTRATSLDGQAVGFATDVVVEWQGRDPVAVTGPTPLPPADSEDRLISPTESLEAGFDGTAIEFAIPLATLGDLRPGDDVYLRAVGTEAFGEPRPVEPTAGPARITLTGTTSAEPIIDIVDPRNDDHGPGDYTQPVGEASLDLRGLQIATDSQDLIATFDFHDSFTASPPTLDLYVDVDPGSGTGRRLLLPGRNAALGDQDGWELAVSIDPGRRSLFTVSGDGLVESRPTLSVSTVASEGTMTVRIPLRLIGEGDPAVWGYAAAVLVFDDLGLDRIGDVIVEPDEIRFGGAPEGTANHSPIIDLAWPGAQEEILSAYEPSPAEPRSADDVALIDLLLAQ